MISAPNKKGFTLIELLVVISIIAILSVIGLTVYGQAQKMARNAKRISDLKAVATALELYYSQNGNQYPDTSSFWRSECNAGTTADNVIPQGFVPKYMISFPSDPSMDITNGGTSCYRYISDGNDYALGNVRVTENSAADFSAYRNFLDPAEDGGTNNCIFDGTNYSAWKVYSPGARCL